MNCAGVRETLPAFALGVAPPPDVSSIELHVETCAACRKEAIDLQRAVTAFGYALAPVEPAVPELEDRVVAAVQTAAGSGSGRRAKRHKRAGVTLLAAAILIAAIGTGAVFACPAHDERRVAVWDVTENIHAIVAGRHPGMTRRPAPIAVDIHAAAWRIAIRSCLEHHAREGVERCVRRWSRRGRQGYRRIRRSGSVAAAQGHRDQSYRSGVKKDRYHPQTHMYVPPCGL